MRSYGENHAFKSCGGDWIVVLKKRPDTKTNEDRYYITDKRYAKFRADRLDVVGIHHKFVQGRTRDSINNSIYPNEKLWYLVGSDVHEPHYHPDSQKICVPGIHYYLSWEPAFYSECTVLDNGIYRRWDENGGIEAEGMYKNGKPDGKWSFWHENGMKYMDGKYREGKEIGTWIVWDDTGNKESEIRHGN